MSSKHLIAEGEEGTLIILRRTLTVPKTALAGVMLEILSAIFMASMAAFSKETVFSRPFGRCDLGAMVEAQGNPRGSGAGCMPCGVIGTLIETGVDPVIVCPMWSELVGGRKKVAFIARRSADHPESLLSPGRRSNVVSLIPSYFRPSCYVGGAFPKHKFLSLPLVPSGSSDPIPRTRSRM